MGNVPRSVAGPSMLELDGAQVGALKSVDGGEIVAEVVVEPIGQEPFAKKHLGGVRYEELVLGLDLGTAGSVFAWVAESWNGQAKSRDGAVVETDAKLAPQARREFRHALITETTIPTLDAASKTPAQLTVKLAPEEITRKKAGGAAGQKVGAKQKQWLASNFRLELDGLETKAVSKIDAFTVKQTVAADDVGDVRISRREPGKLEFPNLRITFGQASLQSWSDWFDDFVVKGENTDDKEKNGAIVFLDATLKQELGRIELKNVGIFALRRQPSTDQVARVTAELYVESMELKWSAA
jgi:T4-like virus tail tube protein gp19